MIHDPLKTSKWFQVAMSCESLYDVLLVDQNATLDDIKLAFKKRALQVHPDKGGSKEAFHLVYQALETLADPEARAKYDNTLSQVKTRPEQRPHQRVPGRKKKAPKKPGHRAAEKEPKPKRPAAHGGKASTAPAAPATQQSKQTKLLIRIHDLLKQLPRHVRNDVICKQFSQKQRLILERWMVDMSTEGGKERSLALATESLAASARSPGTAQDGHCSVLALPAASASFSRKEFAKQTAKRTKRKRNKESKGKVRSTAGYLKKDSRGSLAYRAGICFDSFEMLTKKCDFQTALEYLVVLTAAKQKMRDPKAPDLHFEERLQAALVSSAKEHGKDLADLRLSFVLIQAAGFFIGISLRAPTVRSIDILGRMRCFMEAFRQYAKNGGNRCIYWQYSPAHLQDAWERFQKGVAHAWEIAGANSTDILQKIQALHKGRTEFRIRQLQKWEQGHMAMQDKNWRRPKRLRTPLPFRAQKYRKVLSEREECRRMALEDRKRHRPRGLRGQNYSRKLLALKRLLARWESALKRKARLLDKARRKVIEEKKAQRKKTQEERRRLEALNQKRLKEEERLRRKALRKRMRSDLTMDEILGRHDADGPDRKKWDVLRSWAFIRCSTGLS